MDTLSFPIMLIFDGMKKYFIILICVYCCNLYSGKKEEKALYFPEYNGQMLVFCTDAFVTRITLTQFAINLLNTHFPECLKGLSKVKYIFDKKPEKYQPLARLMKRYEETGNVKDILMREITGHKRTDDQNDTGQYTIDGAKYYYVDSMPIDTYLGGYYKLNHEDECGSIMLNIKEEDAKFWTTLRDFCYDRTLDAEEKMDILRSVFPPTIDKNKHPPKKQDIYNNFDCLYGESYQKARDSFDKTSTPHPKRMRSNSF